MKFKMILLLSAGILFISCKATVSKLSERNNSKEAKIQIKNMVKSAGQYKLEEGTLPGDCWETMLESGHIEITEAVTDSWEFECSWDWDTDTRRMVGTVSATSTHRNAAGPGNVIEYYIEEDSFYGYGQRNEE